MPENILVLKIAFYTKYSCKNSMYKTFFSETYNMARFNVKHLHEHCWADVNTRLYGPNAS